MRLRRPRRVWVDFCFNPHPANRPGDAFCVGVERQGNIVSIHTRPIGRVMPIFVHRTPAHHRVSIHTRPIGRVMREFMRHADAHLGPRATDRFNPHPANRPGDAFARGYADATVAVSIHTRPIGRVMHLQVARRAGAQDVSIHTRPIGRVMLCRCNRLFLRQNDVSLRDSGSGRKFQAPPGICRPFENIDNQTVRHRANLPGFRRRLGFAPQTRSGPSKSTERKTPYCLTRISYGSASR
jgi:hypothetical protein